MARALARWQVGAIDAHLARLVGEFRSARSASDYAALMQLQERIDVLLDRRLRATMQESSESAAVEQHAPG